MKLLRKTTGQDMLEATFKKRQLRWFGRVGLQRMKDSRRAKQEMHWIPCKKRNRV